MKKLTNKATKEEMVEYLNYLVGKVAVLEKRILNIINETNFIRNYQDEYNLPDSDVCDEDDNNGDV